jgi:3-methyl-2-oxobutanoate hydroxymethyltransferase
VRIPHLQEMKRNGEKWAMLTAYDMYSAEVFDEAGIPVLLVGDSASDNVLANGTTHAITVDEMLPLARAVSRSATRALVLADLPFGSYERSAEQAHETALRFVKETGVHAVKMEGGPEIAPQVRVLSTAGIPVMAHIGFTPQAEHALGGYRIQGRGEDAERLRESARVLEEAGAFALLIEMVPAEVAARIAQEVRIPVVGIGAGDGCDAQVLVWQDMVGLRTGRLPRFVKQYADMRGMLTAAAREFAEEVGSGAVPGPEHSF